MSGVESKQGGGAMGNILSPFSGFGVCDLVPWWMNEESSILILTLSFEPYVHWLA